MANVISSTRAVRDLVNIRRRHREIGRDSSSLNTIASALDTLSDTAEAIGAYGKEPVSDRDRTYLASYGVLQALYMQQDATFWLCRLLGIDPISGFESPGKWSSSVPAIEAARMARNNSVGHPVRREKGGPLASFFLVQSTLRLGNFQLLQSEGKKRQFVSVNVSKLAEEQLAAVDALLRDAAHQLREKDKGHKRQFMNSKLRAIFNRLDHAVSHLGAVSESDTRLMVPGFANMIRDGMDGFRRALREREEPFEADLQFAYQKLSRALRVLDDHVRGVAYADGDLAEVAASCVYHEIEELKAYAQGIDDDYAQTSPPSEERRAEPESDKE